MTTDARTDTAPKISFVSLGCPKALVDSERIVTHLRSEGYEIARRHDGADVVIVNTCGFLDSAKAESLDAIGKAMSENGKVIVTGCMGAEPEQIRDAFPGVLAITGPQAYESVMSAVHEAIPPAHDPFLDLVPPQGVKLTPRHYAYLKISEGCHNRCSFCIIPKLRGDLVSGRWSTCCARRRSWPTPASRNCWSFHRTRRPMASTSSTRLESGRIARSGRASTTSPTLSPSSASGCASTMSTPYPHVDEVISLMADGKVLPYLDIPVPACLAQRAQGHAPPGASGEDAERIAKWRDICPDLAIRSTFIVGFPGERRKISRCCSTGSPR
jgi:SSU ribosomal protein S12P methylthiotransferase (EC 2.-.-.-)